MSSVSKSNRAWPLIAAGLALVAAACGQGAATTSEPADIAAVLDGSADAAGEVADTSAPDADTSVNGSDTQVADAPADVAEDVAKDTNLPDVLPDVVADVMADIEPVPDVADTTAAVDAAPADTGPVAGTSVTLTPFDKTHFYFTSSDNKRTVDAPVAFPAAGAFEKIILHLTLACPAGGCDPWDRLSSLSVVTATGTNGAPDTTIEVARFVTPYKVGGNWDIDVTDLRPLLTGNVTLRGFIDTWSGGGGANGDGWLLSASFEMTGGVPAKLPIAVVPLWGPSGVVYGDPAKPIAQSLVATTPVLPKASSYAVRTLVTGHGQGNAENCAEFCGKTHTLTVGTAAHSQKVWRTDCKTTAAPGQQGTYAYSRAGWCPGADVLPWVTDITADVAAGSSPVFSYDIEAYENTCRPDSPVCKGCTLGTGCEYDGASHTEPFFQVSAVVVGYL